MKLWILRHARVLLEDGLCYGASNAEADPDLTRQAALAAATRLPNGLPVWVSGLKRAQQLVMELYQLRPDLQPSVVDHRLNEMNFGYWELQAWDNIPRKAFDQWMADFAHHRFGGIESTQQVIDRVVEVVHELLNRGVKEAVWVTHAGVFRAVTYWVVSQGKEISNASEWPQRAPEPGELVVVEF